MYGGPECLIREYEVARPAQDKVVVGEVETERRVDKSFVGQSLRKMSIDPTLEGRKGGLQPERA